MKILRPRGATPADRSRIVNRDPRQRGPRASRFASGRKFAGGTAGLLLLAQLATAADPGAPANASMIPEAQKESDWVDNRWAQSDVGSFLSSTLNVPGNRITRALSIKVGDRQQGAVCYDTTTASWRAAWQGGFLRFDAARYGLMRPPSVDGTMVLQANPAPNALRGVRFTGMRLHDGHVVIESTLGDVSLQESPWLVQENGRLIFTRRLDVGPATQPLNIGLAVSAGAPAITTTNGALQFLINGGAKNKSIAFHIGGPASSLRVVHKNGALHLELAPAAGKRSMVIAFSESDSPADATKALADLRAAAKPEELAPWLAPGRARWLPEIQTRGQRGLDLDLLSVDTLTLPYNNPWKALLFLAGVDFSADGTAYVCSIHGDVWRITGVDDSLRELRWHRFATGLFQPLGLKVRRDGIYVLGRDRITRLHDENGDGEADYYETFCNQIETSAGGHDYVTCLESDDAGNFYYVDPRGVHRVSPDGQRMETLASGWRNPNGLGVSPDGQFLTVAPQQGEWTPSSQISRVRPGGYFGYGGPRVAENRPLGYDAPLCWLPHAVDNSSGSQVWVPRGQWGALGGQMLHLLWGRCGLMLVLRDSVRGVDQGAVVPLPGRFLSGPNRGSFNQRDGHLYVAGSTGWQTAAARDGALQRVRFTGKPVTLPVAWHAHRNGLSLTFGEPLERAAAENAGSYGAHQWNYRYAASYGSKDWSVANPQTEGRDEVPIRSARLEPDGKTVFLEMPALTPVMQMEIKYSLNTAAGKALRQSVWLTLNALDAEKTR
jgi:hypothetical protein